TAPADFLAMNAPSVAALADTSEVAAGEDAVNAFLANHGAALSVVDYREVQPKSMHAVRLLGARQTQVDGDTVLELLYDCCGRPAKVLIAPRDSAAADHILEAKHGAKAQINWYDQDHSPGEGPYPTGLMGVQKTGEVGGFVAGVVSVHPTEGLLDVLKSDGGAATAVG
ncbi:MAG: hypothetical protein IT368_18340, partial [Candidatus Hydrogenedentes bacterium]|nr:hypothetical protein [Candidatus Hydrogenedentota bacterium]